MSYNPLIDLCSGFSPEEKIANQQNKTNDLLSNVIIAQQEANKNQSETNKILRSQCEELKRRNEILEFENKEKSKELKVSIIFNVIMTSISIISLIISILK